MKAAPTYCSEYLEHAIRCKTLILSHFKLTSYEIRLPSDYTNKGITKNYVIHLIIAIITTCNTACSRVYCVRVNR